MLLPDEKFYGWLKLLCPSFPAQAGNIKDYKFIKGTSEPLLVIYFANFNLIIVDYRELPKKNAKDVQTYLINDVKTYKLVSEHKDTTLFLLPLSLHFNSWVLYIDEHGREEVNILEGCSYRRFALTTEDYLNSSMVLEGNNITITRLLTHLTYLFRIFYK